MIRSTFVFIAAVILGFTAIQAQTITNGTFETWTDTIHPTNWNTNNNIVNYVRQSVTHHLGNYSALLVTSAADHSGSSGDLSGILTLGKVDVNTQNVTLGKPLSGKPSEFHGYYKYTPKSGSTDNMSITLRITKWNGSARQTLFSNTFSSTAGATITTFTLFSMPITYSPSTAVPDSFNIIIKSSASTANRGSYLWVDDLAFTANTGIEEPIEFRPGVMPNPASDHLFVRLNGEEFDINMYNIAGQKVLSERTSEKYVTLNISSIPEGVYMVTVNNDNYKYTTKIIVNH